MSYPSPQQEPRDAEIASLSEARERRIHAVRAESRDAIAAMLEAVGMSGELAVALEDQAYSSGRIWRRSDV